jgi:hypothetical protein
LMSSQLRWITSSLTAEICSCSGISQIGKRSANPVTHARQRQRTAALAGAGVRSMAGKLTITIEIERRWFFSFMWDFALFCYLLGLVDAESAATWLVKRGCSMKVVSSRRGRGESISTSSRA